MSNDFSKYTNEELQLIYKNQDCNRDEMSSDCEAYNEEGRYTIYVETYNQSGCFITSAVCRTFGKHDDCQELMAFRHFRDSYMAEREDLNREVQNYYEIAPAICAAIDAKGDSLAKQEYARIWDEHLSKAFEALRNNELEKTYDIYKKMVLSLEEAYLS
jgi:hypothetical protein